MGDLNSLIMSLDLNKLMPIGAGALGVVGLLTYLLVKPKKTKEIIQYPNSNEKQEAIATEQQEPKIGLLEETLETNKVDDAEPNIFNEILEESKESRLQDDTLSSFSEQFDVHINETKKEPSITSDFVSQEQDIQNNTLTEDSSFTEANENQVSSTANEEAFYGPTNAEETKVFWQKYGTDLSEQAQHNIEPQNQKIEETSPQEDIFKSLLIESEKVDQQREEQNQIDNSNFNSAFGHIYNQNNEQAITTEISTTSESLTEETKIETQEDSSSIVEQFGDLAGIISNDRRITAEEETSNKEINSNLDVWVNYMCMKQGKMRLLNTFVHLTKPWGTMESISEIQKQIDQEAGFDEQGFKQSWAIISVMPIKQ